MIKVISPRVRFRCIRLKGIQYKSSHSKNESEREGRCYNICYYDVLY